MYKALNTFIDDLFAFIIKMPMAHRLSCLRDDFIFLIYLYQRWLYGTDKTRANEYGQVEADEGQDGEPTAIKHEAAAATPADECGTAPRGKDADVDGRREALEGARRHKEE